MSKTRRRSAQSPQVPREVPLSAQEIARLLGVCKRTAARMIQRHDFGDFVRVGNRGDLRVSHAGYTAYVDNKTVRARK